MDHSAILVGYQDHENLGIGYLASVLLDAGFQPMIVDYRLGPEAILQHIRNRNPLVVGFSIIFQFYTPAFRTLMQYLRRNGVMCHFTAGGHYPSLRCEAVLQSVPELDSIVLFEGEHTFLELTRTLASGGDWTRIDGLAWRSGQSVVNNRLRPLETDLDRFPPPVRSPVPRFALGRKEVPLVAGRGCLYDCSFCSIRQFYSAPPGPLKRVRRPEMVAREMQLLHDELGYEIFLFQDDDFPAAAKNGTKWARRFCDCLRDAGLDRRILWKISCRADEVDRERFAMLREHGLCFAYLGIESGTEDGLRLMNKHLHVDRSIEAVQTLRTLGINCDYGFMLFDPMSTAESVRGNVDFLERLSADGFTAVTACRTIPYAATAIEQMLEEAGRLEVRGEEENYHFLDPAMDDLYEWFVDTFDQWIQGTGRGVLPLCRAAKYCIAVFRRFCSPNSRIDELDRETTEITAAANRVFTTSMRDALELLPPGRRAFRNGDALAALTGRVRRSERDFERRLWLVTTEIEQLAGVTTAELRTVYAGAPKDLSVGSGV